VRVEQARKFYSLVHREKAKAMEKMRQIEEKIKYNLKNNVKSMMPNLT